MIIESAVIGGISFAGLFAVVRYMVGECKRKQVIMDERLDKHGDDLVALNTKSKLAVTA